jgi:hypothetical protein
VIGSRWVFTQKYHIDGLFEWYKGCLITQGFSQCPGFEYLKVFAPTVHLPTLHNLHIWSVNVSNAYLNGDIDCDIYMEQPECFVEGNPKELVCLLKKSRYGTNMVKIAGIARYTLLLSLWASNRHIPMLLSISSCLSLLTT